VPFTWYVALGSVLTFAVGYAASLLYAREKRTGTHA